MTELVKLAQAKHRRDGLLAKLHTVEAVLSTCSPNDPRREELKAKKADLLPRYRSAKQQVKDLNRLVNTQAAEDAGTPLGKFFERKKTEEIERIKASDPEGMLKDLWNILAEASERAGPREDGAGSLAQQHEGVELRISTIAAETVDDFIDYMDHYYGDEDDGADEEGE